MFQFVKSHEYLMLCDIIMDCENKIGNIQVRKNALSELREVVDIVCM